MSEPHQTFETSQPWVVYAYPRTDAEADKLGEALVIMCCAVCGEREEWRQPMRSDEELAKLPPGYKAPARVAFLAAHDHRPLPHALTWALPLLNPVAHRETMDVLGFVVRDAAARADS